ncbi:pilus assembly protein [Agaricicola taiwanensis]|uniref:Pilus assembly protein n=2 Tax=Agaricicola taiwanensis TaxID=591372 RepID=A0A8J2VN82_9RHOB|nr:pilus assembly protein [Agaricicola taiwanensis]
MVLAAMAFGLGACASDPVTTASLAQTYRDRHPIVVTEAAETLDLVPGGGPGGLTERQREDIRGFAKEWREQGRGLVRIEMPKGGATDTAAAHTVRGIRTELTAGGIPSRAMTTSTYPASHPAQLAPVRLSFPKLAADVASVCGQWPEDIGNSLTSRQGRNNGDYSNFGCAYQKNMAAMIADPEDIIRPRAETPASGARRATIMDKYIKGEATGAQPPIGSEDTSISEVGQ